MDPNHPTQGSRLTRPSLTGQALDVDDFVLAPPL
jgi:hypothetical protein